MFEVFKPILKESQHQRDCGLFIRFSTRTVVFRPDRVCCVRSLIGIFKLSEFNLGCLEGRGFLTLTANCHDLFPSTKLRGGGNALN